MLKSPAIRAMTAMQMKLRNSFPLMLAVIFKKKSMASLSGAGRASHPRFGNAADLRSVYKIGATSGFVKKLSKLYPGVAGGREKKRAAKKTLEESFELTHNAQCRLMLFSWLGGATARARFPIIDRAELVSCEWRCGVATGTVKWFSDQKGYGFIVPDDGGQDLFIHHSNILMDGFKTLKDGQKVEFEPAQGRKGPEATKCRPL